MKLAIIGATGLVGRKMIEVVHQRNIPYTELILSASERSVNKVFTVNNHQVRILSVEEVIKLKPDVALFSAGAEASLQYAPIFAGQGCFVIDNSSAWRMNENIPLVVPEVNGSVLNIHSLIIANPNCSTIQLVVAAYPLHLRYGLKRMIISTYQSVSGTGMKGINQLFGERRQVNVEKVYPYPIDMNCLPHGGKFYDNGYTTEEIKLVEESRKIMNLPELEVSATVVRVPVVGGHSESVNLEFEKDIDMAEVTEILKNSAGIVVQDDPASNIYPMPLTSFDRDEVFVGRLRKDLYRNNGLNMWIVADNVRKGAATNAVQILEYLISNHIVDAGA